jgi:hypothetical protein
MKISNLACISYTHLEPNTCKIQPVGSSREIIWVSMSQDSSVSIVTGYCLEVGSLFADVPIGFVHHKSPYPKDAYRSSGVKRPKNKCHNSPSSANVKNAHSYAQVSRLTI